MIHYGTNHVFTSRNGSDTTITLSAGVGETLLVNGTTSSAGLTTNRALTGYYSATSPSLSLTANTWTKVTNTTTADASNYKFTITNNKAVYTGSLPGIFLVAFTVNATGTNLDILNYGVVKNGGASPSASSILTLQVVSGAQAIGNTSIVYHEPMVTGDYLEVFVQNTSGSNAIVTTALNVTITGIF